MKEKLVVAILCLSCLFFQYDAKAGGTAKALKFFGKLAFDVATDVAIGLAINNAQAMIEEEEDRNNEIESIDEEISSYYKRLDDIAMEMRSYALEEPRAEEISEKIPYFSHRSEEVRREIESTIERNNLKARSNDPLIAKRIEHLQKLQQMSQRLYNQLHNTMHQGGMNSIRNIKA